MVLTYSLHPLIRPVLLVHGSLSHDLSTQSIFSLLFSSNLVSFIVSRCISYLLLDNKVPPKLTTWNKRIYDLIVSVIQESRNGLTGWFSVESLMKLQSGYWLGLRSYLRPQLGGWSTPKFTLTTPDTPRALAGHWWKTLVLSHGGLSIGCLNVLMTGRLSIPRGRDLRECTKEEATVFL